MSCGEIPGHILGDEAPGEVPAVREHLARCRLCQALMADRDALDARLRSALHVPSPPRADPGPILAALRATREPSPIGPVRDARPRLVPVGLAVAGAAALTLTLLVGVGLQTSSTLSPPSACADRGVTSGHIGRASRPNPFTRAVRRWAFSGMDRRHGAPLRRRAGTPAEAWSPARARPSSGFGDLAMRAGVAGRPSGRGRRFLEPLGSTSHTWPSRRFFR